MTELTHITRASLALVLEHYGGSPGLSGVRLYEHMAMLLSKLAGREKPWGWRYVQGVSAGTIEPSPAFARAVGALGAVIDDTPPVLAYTVEVKVYARPGALPPFGAIVLSEARPCAWPGCTVMFVPRTPNQRYCNRRLHEQARKQI